MRYSAIVDRLEVRDLNTRFACALLYSRAPCRKSVRKMKALGVIYAGDMLPEVAYVKLGWVLGHGLNPVEEMPKDYLGEVSRRTEEGFGAYPG